LGKASRRKKEAPSGAEEASPRIFPEPRDETGGWITTSLIVVLAAAAIFRIVYFLQYRFGSVFFQAPFLDASIYDQWARRIAAGEWSPPDSFYFAPGYPYALALLYRFVTSSIEAVYVVQLGLGLLNIVLIHRLAALAFGRRAGLVAAILAALYASFPFLETKVMSPIFGLTLQLLSLVLLVAARSRGGWWRWLIAGILLGLASLVRPESLLAAPFILFWMAAWSGRRRGWLDLAPLALPAAALLAGWGLAILPAAIHNVRTGGGSTLISSQGGITFYQSNNARARGLYVFLSREGFSGAPERQAQEEKEIAEKAEGRELTRSEVSSHWFRRGLDFIAGNPGRFLWLLGMKLLRFVGSYEYSTEYILYVERETVPVLWIPFVPFALLVALGAPAIAMTLMGGRAGGAHREAGEADLGGGPGPLGGLNAAGGLLLVTFLANLCTVLLFYVSSRYRLPSAPPLMAFAAVSVVRMGDWWTSRRRSQAYALAGAVGLIFLIAHFDKDESATIQEANVHYNEGNIWSGMKEPEKALQEYRRASSMDDSRYETWFNMGNTLRDLGRHAEAAESYARAAQRRPSFFNAHLREGQSLEEAGEWARARGAYEKAAALKPGEFEVELGLGRAAARMGDRAAAVEHLDRALRIRPGNPAAVAERSRL